MLYLRNTNQQQTLGRDIQRGLTSLCCTPTLNSVTSASFTQLYVDGTLGNYLVDCKSCVGGYIQVTENSGSTWNTINPGNCTSTNLVPMPSQSAYYRLFTSCSSNSQPFDPLTSSFSNEIYYVPNSRLHYNFEENLETGRFTIDVTGSLQVDTSASVIGDIWEIPSASAVSSSIQVLSVPYTGSLSMSLLITGSNVSYYTSSCVLSSSSIFIGSYTAIPNEDYQLTASINYDPGPEGCGTNILDYTVYSCDVDNKIWYPANQSGTFTSASTSYGFITGSISRTNGETGDCRYNALRLSGSATFDSAGSETQVMINVVSGSVAANGVAPSTGNAWHLSANANDTYFRLNIGALNFDTTIPGGGICKNNLLGMRVRGNIGPVPRTSEFDFYVNGVLVNTISFNPNVLSLGPTYILSSDNGVIRTHAPSVTDPSWKTQYDCYYEI